MFAALLWKEWREQRGVIWAGLALSLILPMVIRSSIGVIGAGEDAIIFAQLVALGAMLFAWPLFAALTAASAHAEREPATAGFLLSRPVSLGEILTAKVVASCLALGVVVSASFGVAQVVHHRYLGEWLTFPYVPGSFPAAGLSQLALAAIVGGGTMLVFACTQLCASWARHQLAAAGLGVTLAVAVVYAGLFLQDALSAVSRVDASPKFLLIFLGIASMGALVGTHLLFTAGIDRYGPGRLRRLALALTAFAACAAVGAVTAGAAITRVVPTGWGALAVAELLPGRAEALIRVDGGAYSGAAFWLVGNTTAPRQITRRLTSQANFLPDGTWVVYDTRRGSLGLRRDDCELRRVRTDGSGDRLVIGGQPCDAERFFSRDSTRVALRIVHEAFHPDPRGFVPRTTREALRIIWLDASRAPSELDLSDPTGELRSFTPHGWVLGDRYLLLSGLRTLNLLDVETGAITELFRSPVALDMHGRPVRYEGLGAEIVSPSRAFVATRGVAAFRAGACDSCSRAVIDLSSGELLPLPSCPSGRRGDIVAAAGGERYWVSCSTPPDTWLTSDTSPPAWDAQIGLVNDGAGDVEFVATLPRQWNRGRVLASPDGERLLVTLLQPSRLRDPDRLRRYLVVHRTGRVVELESLADAGAVVPAETTSDRHAVLRNRWEIEGWLSNENIAVSRDAERFTIMRSRSFTEFGYTNASLDSPVVLLRRGEGR